MKIKSILILVLVAGVLLSACNIADLWGMNIFSNIARSEQAIWTQ